MIVASIVFKLADVTGLLGFIANVWEFARGNGRAVIILSVIVFTLITIVYIGWLGLRLPYLIEQQFEIKKKRDLRRQKFLDEYKSNSEKLST